MNVHVSPHAPSPGATAPGDLYVELATRTMWIGVDTSVDSSGSLLLSDIMAIQPAIDVGVITAKSYTDAQILTRAPTVHTHTANQITDFTAAVAAVIGTLPGVSWVRGMIMQWSGSLAEIGVGSLAGWQLCDGTNGTPDLRDKFVLGAGSRAVGSVPASTSFNTTAGGGHDHTVNATAITIAQMPSHDHTPGTGGESTDHVHYVSGQTDDQGNHYHNISVWNGTSGRLDGAGGNGTPSVGANTTTDWQGTHRHNIGFWSGGRNAGHTHAIYAQGSNQGHSHTLVGGGGSHQHTITGAQMREALPFYALAFIMKL